MTHAGQAIRPREKAELTVPRGMVAGCCLAIVSTAAAVIHFAVAGAHFQEYWLFGVFMLVAAWFQVLWAVAVVVRASRSLLWGGAVVNAAVVAVYIVTRTAGDVVGPTPHEVEPFGFGDGLCTVLEAVVVAGCAWLLLARADRHVSRRDLVIASAATAAVTAVLLNVALVAGGPEMVMTSAAAHNAPATRGAAQLIPAGRWGSPRSHAGISPLRPSATRRSPVLPGALADVIAEQYALGGGV